MSAQDSAYAEVQRLQAALGNARQERDALLLTIADSAAFISSLENKITALNDTSTIAEYIGDVRFNVCPACYSQLDAEADAPAHACHLCKTPFDSERIRGRIVALINDAAIQLRQSRTLQSERDERLKRLDAQVKALEQEWHQASHLLTARQTVPSNESLDQLRILHRQAGYLDRQIENLEEKASLIQIIDELANRKNELNDKINRLKSENEILRVSQEQRLSRAYTIIADEIRTLLRNDLRRQDSFENPQSVEFDFVANKISIDGHSYFSASSRVILKSSFFLGFFGAATKDPLFRHPRFCMIDTIEDKGMEPERSHNFQMQILRVSENAQVEHQIIYATAMIAPDLEDERYTIGSYSTRDQPTLNIKS